MKYRTLLTEIIHEVVLQGTEDVVGAWAAEHLPEVDRPRFVTLVDAELHGLAGDDTFFLPFGQVQFYRLDRAPALIALRRVRDKAVSFGDRRYRPHRAR